MIALPASCRLTRPFVASSVPQSTTLDLSTSQVYAYGSQAPRRGMHCTARLHFIDPYSISPCPMCQCLIHMFLLLMTFDIYYCLSHSCDIVYCYCSAHNIKHTCGKQCHQETSAPKASHTIPSCSQESIIHSSSSCAPNTFAK